MIYRQKGKNHSLVMTEVGHQYILKTGMVLKSTPRENTGNLLSQNQFDTTK